MTIVALIPAFMSEDRIGATASAVASFVDEVLVIDDGSTDATAAVARSAGASVVCLPRNRGKAHAVGAGVAARPRADTYLLVDADLASTASNLRPLLGPVTSGATDIAIGRLPSAGGRGGFGLARNLASWGIHRATGWRPEAPLSGQRAVKGALLRALYATGPPASRFGLEVGLTIDALRNGARITEVEVDVDHHHRGRTFGGFRHRGSQAADIFRALWPRLVAPRMRTSLVVVALLAALVVSHLGASRAEPASLPLIVAGSEGPDRILLYGMPGLSVADIEAMPELSSLARKGAVGALTVRTRSGFPGPEEAYATLGAGTRVDALAPAGQAFDVSESLEGGVAGDALVRRSGVAPAGQVVVVGFPSARRQAGDQVSSRPGALGEALGESGLTTAVVGNADVSRPRIIADPELGPADPEEPVVPDLSRPAAIALADSSGSVDLGTVGPGLLQSDPLSPFGLRADPQAVLTAAATSLEAGADVLLVDPGDLERAQRFAELATLEQATAQRAQALARTDEILGSLVELAGPDTLVIAFGSTPPRKRWHLTPLVVAGPGVRNGSLIHSPSTRRPGVATLTDLAPTVLDVLGAEKPTGMIGHSLRRTRAEGLATDELVRRLDETDRIASYRERIYLGSTMAYIVFQALLYILALWVFVRLGRKGRSSSILRLGVLAVAAHPVGTFLHRGLPVHEWGPFGVALLPLIDLAIAGLALRLARRESVAPLGLIAGLTIAVLAFDSATGERLQLSSLLGYSFHSAGRFTGFGNTAFAILAATTVLGAAIHVHRAPRKRDAVVAAGALFIFVAVLDGSPALGSDVGGILTLVPVFGLTLVALAGARLSLRKVGLAAVVTAGAVALAVGVDLARPAASRTHLGRLAAEVFTDGGGPLLDVIVRKGAANLRTWGSPWVWGLAVLAISLITAAVMDRGWFRIVPRHSALRAGFMGTVAAGVLGYAVNDSGVVVAALILVYLGPFLTLIALDADPEPDPLELDGDPLSWMATR